MHQQRYQCPKGHPYSVGECGKPMEEAKCHCGAIIGGKDHRNVKGEFFFFLEKKISKQIYSFSFLGVSRLNRNVMLRRGFTYTTQDRLYHFEPRTYSFLRLIVCLCLFICLQIKRFVNMLFFFLFLSQIRCVQ